MEEDGNGRAHGTTRMDVNASFGKFSFFSPVDFTVMSVLANNLDLE